MTDEEPRVVVDIEVQRIAFTSEALQFVTTVDGIDWQRGLVRGQRALGEGELERIGAPLHPLVAVRVSERVEFGDMHAMIDVDGPFGPKLVMIGRAVDGGRITRCGERWFVIDYDALIAHWQFV